MNSREWLSLNGYSAKHKISLSTLRRRIRAREVEFKLEGGKYLLLDKSAGNFSQTAVTETGALVGEIKNAYKTILQEKEQQILQLKEEIVDLKTLVEILETENSRLKSNAIESAPIDPWLSRGYAKELRPEQD